MSILKNKREAVKVTQVQMANQVGISVVGYQNYEAGKRVPDVYIAQKIAKILHTTVEDLFPIPSVAADGIQKQPDGSRA